MAQSPQYKVYSADGVYLAACKHIEDAAAVVALNGGGSTIRRGHAKRDTVWTEGVDGYASDSIDAPGALLSEKCADTGDET